MKSKLLIFCLIIAGFFHVHNAAETSDNTKSTLKTLEPSVQATTAAAATQPSNTDEVAKDKRQIDRKDTQIYPNHRSDDDDPENPQETIYGSKPNQFIIRPIAPHQQQQQQQQQQQEQYEQIQPQLRNYPVTIRPHNTQLLEQSQEIQHFAYLHDISRNQPKGSAAAQRLSKLQQKRISARTQQHQQEQQQNSAAEEAEQRYAIAIQQAPGPIPQPRHYQPSQQAYQVPTAQQQQQQHVQQQQQRLQQQYQIIPEEQFLRLIEEELQARAYHEQQARQQGLHAATAANHVQQSTEKAPEPGLGSYRQRAPAEEPAPEYVQYVPRHRGGPKYLPLTKSQTAAQVTETQVTEPEAQQPQPQPQQYSNLHEIPPQLAYYQPQISYRTLPSHPLAKSSLEKEIEKLIAANKPSTAALEIIDNSNEPSAKVNHHRQPPPPRPLYSPKEAPYSSNTQLDANNQPFIPSLFHFSSFPTPTPIYPTQAAHQLTDGKNSGPVVYPTQSPSPQTSQYYYQKLATPTPKAKAFRAKSYGLKVGPSPKPNDKYAASPNKYSQPLLFDYENQLQHQREQQSQTGPVQFSPSPIDPNKPQSTPQSAPIRPTPTDEYRQYVLPVPSPSQSSIFVSQGTGVEPPLRTKAATPAHKKTADDVKQLHLPQPGGKPLTQAEFQALIDAGYPVTAVPVPVPVPYEQYVKDHPEYRNQPVDYAQLMRNFAHQQQQQQEQQQRYQHAIPPPPPPQQQRYTYPHQQRAFGAASEPSVKILSSPTEQQHTASALGGGSVTYLRPISEQQRRHPRDEKDTKVEGENVEKVEKVEKK